MGEPSMLPLRWPGMRSAGVLSAVAFDGEHREGRWHRGVPSTSLTLVVATADPVGVGGGTHRPPDVRHRLPALVAGLQRTAAWTREEGRLRGVQLALSPLAAARLLGAPASELAPGADGHTTVALNDVVGRSARELGEELAEAGDDPVRLVDVARRWCERPTRGGTAYLPRPQVAHAWRLALACGGRTTVAALARQVHLSERQLRTLVTRELGIGPRQVLRLARFEQAHARVVEGRDATLADTAAASGYADHSHLDRDWRELLGTSPSGWLAEERRNVQAGGHRHRQDGDHD